MKNKSLIILFVISIILVLSLIVLGISLFSPTPTRETQQDTQTPTPVDQSRHQSSGQEPPFPSPNPTFTELLKTQPFWDMLPHYGENFLVEYFQSDETFIITTIDPGNVPNRTQLLNKYRQEARDWLTQNGAVLNELNIMYRPNIN